MLAKVSSPSSSTSAPSSPVSRGIWSREEHDRFLDAMKLYPKGPWKAIADHIETRSVRQVQTHAQKYQEKVSRRLRGLRKSKKKLVRPEHRIDEDTMELCKLVDSATEKLAAASSRRSSVSSPGAGGFPDDQKHEAIRDSVLADIKTEPLDPLQLDCLGKDGPPVLPVVDLYDNIELDPVHVPSVSESLDFLIEYLSIGSTSCDSDN